MPAVRSERGAPLVWFLVAAAAPLGFLAKRIPLDLWYDEVYTLVHFVHRPWTEIVLDYSAPNNHIAYSLLLRPLWLLGAQPLELRLFSYLLAVVTLLLVFVLAWRLAGREVAVWSTALLGLSQMYLVHAIQVRGYGLSMLLVTALANLAMAATSTLGAWTRAPRQTDAPSKLNNQLPSAGAPPLSPELRCWWWRTAGIVAAVTFALYAIPTNVLFVVPLATWSIGRAWRRCGALGAAIESAPWLAGLLLAVMLYLPVIGQLRSHAVGPARPSLDGMLQLAGDFLWAAGHDAWPLAPLAVLGLIAWLVGSRKAAGSDVVSLVSVVVVGPFVIAWARGITPFLRNFCPLLPMLAVGMAWLALVATDAVAQRFFARTIRGTLWAPIAGLVLMLAVFAPPLLSYPARLTALREQQGAVQDGYFNYYAADFEPARVADVLSPLVQDEPNFHIAYDDADYYNLVYYLIAEGIAAPPPPENPSQPPAPGYLYVVLSPKPNLTRLQARIAIPADQWTRWPEVARVGYYRVLRSPERRSLVELQKSAPPPPTTEPIEPFAPSFGAEIKRLPDAR